MPRRRWVLLAVFVAWTTYVWVTRIANAWGSASTETTGGKVVSTVLSGVMLAFAVGGVVVLVQTWRRPLTVGAARFLQGFCGVTVVVWVVRAVQIIASDHDVPFKVVHVVLGVISIALAAAVWRTAAPVGGRRSPDRPPVGGSDRPLADAGDGGRR
jgi:hypothetical protein